MSDTPAQRLLADRLRFPGLLPREVLILREWLRTHEREYDAWDFNVRVGAGMDPGPTFDDNIRKMALDVTRKRIDAVAVKGDSATLIEVKDRAGASAIGQLLTYLPLFRAAFPQYTTVTAMLLTNRLAPDLLPVIQATGIILAVVEVDFSSLARRS